jgi:MerR family transcriptional regulator, copper efflux regulator
MKPFTIGQVAARTGFSASALRYYEEQGLLAPAARTEAGYRVYDDNALRRLAFIARAKQLGCTLEEITDLLAVWDGDQCGPVQRRFHDLVTDKLDTTQRQITELIAFASQLQSAAARLDTPPIDGPCDSECACLADNDAPTATPVMLAASRATSAPIACTLEAGAMPERLSAWQALLTNVRARTTTPDGRLRVEFDDRVDLAELASLVGAEQQCCRFFDFTLTIDRRGTGLEIVAPDEAADLVSAMFGAAS